MLGTEGAAGLCGRVGMLARWSAVAVACCSLQPNGPTLAAAATLPRCHLIVDSTALLHFLLLAIYYSTRCMLTTLTGSLTG